MMMMFSIACSSIRPSVPCHPCQGMQAAVRGAGPARAAATCVLGLYRAARRCRERAGRRARTHACRTAPPSPDQLSHASQARPLPQQGRAGPKAGRHSVRSCSPRRQQRAGWPAGERAGERERGGMGRRAAMVRPLCRSANRARTTRRASDRDALRARARLDGASSIGQITPCISQYPSPRPRPLPSAPLRRTGSRAASGPAPQSAPCALFTALQHHRIDAQARLATACIAL
jgi:hypothetical protein